MSSLETRHQAGTAFTGERDQAAVTPSGRRLVFLDVVRGIAALAVLFQHLVETSFPRWLGAPYLNMGASGVCAFFLVSGFIIPASLEKHASLGPFWAGRVRRLYPMYTVVMFVTLVFVYLGLWPSPFIDGHRAWVCIAANLTMLEEFFGIHPIVGVGWTLGLEMIVDILCSAAFALGWLKHAVPRLIGAIGGLLALSIWSFATHHAIPAGRLGFLVTCFFGTLVYRIYRGQEREHWLWLGLPMGVVLLASFWLRFHMYSGPVGGPATEFTFKEASISWGLAYVFFFAMYSLRTKSFPAPLAWLGKVSYSFYLIAGLLPVLLPLSMGPLLRIFLSVAGALLLAPLSYRYIERPLMTPHKGR